jgi:uncharacterized membrane protein YkoI
MRKKVLAAICIASAVTVFAGCSNTAPSAVSAKSEAAQTNSASNTANSNTAQNQTSQSDTGATTITPSAQTNPSSGAVNSSNNQNAPATVITEEDAKNIALTDAKVSEADIDAINVYLEYDDGYQIFNVEFYANGLEFDYEINAVDGYILDRDSEIDNDFYSWDGTNADSNVNYTIEDAKAAALEKVPGADESHIRIEQDYDHGRTIYEGSIYFNGFEYEFEYDASNGQFIQWEQEWD